MSRRPMSRPIPSVLYSAIAIGLMAASAAQADTTYSAAVVSDYRFRGISQSWGDPSLQAGLEHGWTGGAYAGAWTASVSDDLYYGGSFELDLYAGWRGTLTEGVGFDVGVLRYLYPGAEASFAAPVVPADGFDTTELYFGVSRGAFGAKLWYSVGDYFGVNDAFTQNVGLCANLTGAPASCAAGSAVGPGRGGSSGSWYLELNWSHQTDDLGSFTAHAGRLSVANYAELDLTDLKLGWSKPFGSVTVGLAYHHNVTEDGYYVLTAPGGDVLATDDAGFVISASVSF